MTADGLPASGPIRVCLSPGEKSSRILGGQAVATDSPDRQGPLLAVVPLLAWGCFPIVAPMNFTARPRFSPPSYGGACRSASSAFAQVIEKTINRGVGHPGAARVVASGVRLTAVTTGAFPAIEGH